MKEYQVWCAACSLLSQRGVNITLRYCNIFVYTHNGSLRVLWFACTVTSLNSQSFCIHLSFVGCPIGPIFGWIIVGYLSEVNSKSHGRCSVKHLFSDWEKTTDALK